MSISIEPELPPSVSDPLIRIGLGRSVTKAEFSAPGGMYVIAEDEVDGQTPPSEVLQLNLSGDRI